jgi:hypothetical protein
VGSLDVSIIIQTKLSGACATGCLFLAGFKDPYEKVAMLLCKTNCILHSNCNCFISCLCTEMSYFSRALTWNVICYSLFNYQVVTWIYVCNSFLSFAVSRSWPESTFHSSCCHRIIQRVHICNNKPVALVSSSGRSMALSHVTVYTRWRVGQWFIMATGSAVRRSIVYPLSAIKTWKTTDAHLGTGPRLSRW